MVNKQFKKQFNYHRREGNIYQHTGLMRNVVRVVKKEYSEDAMGFGTYATKELCTAWAKVEPTKVEVDNEDGVSFLSNALKFTIYYNPEVDDTCVIIWNGEEHQVVTVENVDQANKYMIVTTKTKGVR